MEALLVQQKPTWNETTPSFVVVLPYPCEPAGAPHAIGDENIVRGAETTRRNAHARVHAHAHARGRPQPRRTFGECSTIDGHAVSTYGR